MDREQRGQFEIALTCSVRGCAAPLSPEEDRLCCPSGHSFDLARQGYWNLLQPQDKRSPRPGDSAEVVEARARWLARGHADELIAEIEEFAQLDRLARGATVVDLGCGEGYFDRRLFRGRTVRLCGVDLSTAALRLAARQWPAATWVVANADRFVPVAEGSPVMVLSLFGRRPRDEIARILRPTGSLIAVVPAEDDLLELRGVAQGRAELRNRVPGVIEALQPTFRLTERRVWRRRTVLHRDSIDDALRMTYRGERRSERERLAGTETLEVTLAADLLRFMHA